MRNQSKRLLLICLLLVTGLNGCSKNEAVEQETGLVAAADVTEEITEKSTEVIRLEAEEGTLTGNMVSEHSKNGYTGEGYVTGMKEDGDTCTFKVPIDKSGFYDLHFISASQGGYKENSILLDGENIGVITAEKETFTDSVLSRIYLEAGEHQVTVAKSWGWIDLDSLVVTESAPLDEGIYDVSAKLIDEQADDCAKRLMSYLTDVYGEKVLSGQYSENGMYGNDMSAVWRVTGGKFAAVLGLDFIEYSPSRAARGSTSKATDYAIEFWNKGGIVTFCWHWNVPEKYLTGTWWKGFYTDSVNIDLAAIMNGEDEEGYELLMQDIDTIAKQLKILQENEVPILFRPLHEASGGWFWWGDSGPEAYIKLWKVLYDRITNVHGIHNLIWVWNGQDKDWYPGDEYVDMIGEDIYPGEKVYTSQSAKFMEALEYTDERKMIILSENGCIPDPELLVRDGAMWGIFCTWSGEFVTKSSNVNIWSDQYTEEYMVKKAYEDENVITLDELPDLKEYPIHD